MVVTDSKQLVKLLPQAPLRPRCVQRYPWTLVGGLRFRPMGSKAVKQNTIARGDAEALRFGINSFIISLSASAPLRLCAR